MTKNKIFSMRQHKHLFIIFLFILLALSFLYIFYISTKNKYLSTQLEKIDGTKINNTSLENQLSIFNPAIDLVLSQKDARNIFCNNENAHIRISQNFTDSWQVRITEFTESDEFGLKEYRVDKSTEKVSENSY